MTNTIRPSAVPARLLIYACLFLVGTSLPPSAQAKDLELIVGPGAIYAPDYEGSADHEFQPFPFIVLNYRDILFVNGSDIGVNLIRAEAIPGVTMSLGPIARYRRDRPENRNEKLRGLGDVGVSIETGGFLRLESGGLWLQVAGATEVLEGHGGVVADVQVGAETRLSNRLSANLAVAAAWTDDKYVGSYFGVTPEQSVLSGLPAYTPGSGFKDVGTTLGLSYALSEHWIASAFGGYTRLLGDAADSPLVRLRGKRDQLSGGLFVGYRF